ncbi:MAG: DUF389 domain-containing protein, partial [Deltaproteobacteria bacterium]|nr:DUF389 domain-containing protein [Deltaproteobacteria bacterium]
MRALFELASVTPERRATVLSDIDQGSQATAVYYVLLGLSELIAGFALMINSDATLIGANVVAPLMTPIFGVALGLMRGDLRLLRAALVAEFGGALLGAVLCFGLGLLPFTLEPSRALLAQTQPTLIDLLVATLAGFAGGLAMIDERVSPALPGVAIATALNPPIAAMGLCLAYGAYGGAWGAFLLFFANVLAILAVAAVLFLIAGFVTRAEIGSLRGLARRFAAAAIGLLLVTALLTSHLIGVVRDLRTDRTITAVLDDELAQEPSVALAGVEFTRSDGGIDVLSTVRTPRVLAPERVRRIQDALSERLGAPVRLFLRCSLTKDVTATGSINLRPYLSLNGKIAEEPMSPGTRILQQAEQIGREVVATRPNIVLTDVELLQLSTGPVLVFSIQNPREPSAENVGRFEVALRDRLGEPGVRVVVRTVDSTDITSKGRILLGEAHFADLTADQARQQAAVEQTVQQNIERTANMFVTAIDAIHREWGWSVRAEVTGPRVLSPEEVRGAEQRSTAALGEEVEVEVRSRTDLIVTGQHYTAVRDTPAPGDVPAQP